MAIWKLDSVSGNQINRMHVDCVRDMQNIPVADKTVKNNMFVFYLM